MAKKYTSRPSVTTEPAEIAADQPHSGDQDGADKGVKKQRRTHKRLTLKLPVDLDFRLEAVAGFEDKHKAAFAIHLITTGLRRFKADESLKNVYEAIRGQNGEAA